jgi:hypothetical protein
MSAFAALPAPAWSRRRWWVTIGSVCLAHLAAISVFSVRPSLRVGPPAPPGSFRLALGGEARELGELPWLSEATEFALASAHGFSGPVWQRLPRLAQRSVEWDEPPRWLTWRSAGQREAADPGSFAPGPGITAAEPPAAVSLVRPVQAAALASPVLRLAGDLRGRMVVGSVDLPVWENPDVLQPTTIEALVDGHGAVLTATLLVGASSGLEAADQRALQLTRALKFAPAPAGAPRLTWGRLVFIWQTCPPGSAPPAAPPPP